MFHSTSQSRPANAPHDQSPIALVTGAGHGLGKAFSLELAKRDHHVILTGRSMDRLEAVQAEILSNGGSAETHHLDVTDYAEAEELARTLQDAGRSPGVLVANSGIGGPSALLWDVAPAEWEEVFDVNVHGTFSVCRAFMPGMIAARSGSVIIIGSATGKKPLVNRSAYAGSKLALVGITRTLALDAGPYGVRVNLISPAVVTGDRMRWVVDSLSESDNSDSQKVEERFTSQTALRRWTEAEEVAQAVAFLASDNSSGITGEDLNVSAGYAMD